MVFNASIAFGIAATSPLFIAVGTLLTIPATDAIDYFWIDPGKGFIGTGQLIASAAIVLSFVITLIFDEHSEVESAESIGRITARASIVGNRNADEETLPTTRDSDAEDSLLDLRILASNAGDVDEGE